RDQRLLRRRDLANLAIGPPFEAANVPLDPAANRSGTLTALSAVKIPRRVGTRSTGTLASGFGRHRAQDRTGIPPRQRSSLLRREVFSEPFQPAGCNANT